MGKVKVYYFGFLTELSGKEFEEVELPSADKVRLRDIVCDEVKPLLDRLVILVNDISVNPDYWLKPGDTVKLLPHIGGG